MSKRKNPNDMPVVPVSAECMRLVSYITMLAMQISSMKNSLTVNVNVSGAINHVSVFVTDDSVTDPAEKCVYSNSIYMHYKMSESWLNSVKEKLAYMTYQGVEA
ncbi:hypothetical protein [Sansalvadorimonas verongulae]|uniref:hypothetical protein n=1 Tax=Sansalvadorimonas verongulae TaxID=2172824 RepID=UPI0012BD51C1|nr:hypothetical protein [Sansalvadorimonas verongulae]MTI11928.1 hypothetical protein [Sansalvadorimonas verongulae]